MFGCIVSFVLRNLCLGTYRRNRNLYLAPPYTFSFTIKLVTHTTGRFYAKDVKVVETLKSTAVKTGRKVHDTIEKKYSFLKKKQKKTT